MLSLGPLSLLHLLQKANVTRQKHDLVKAYENLVSLVASKGIQLDAREVWQVAEQLHDLRTEIKQALERLDTLIASNPWLQHASNAEKETL